MKSVSYELTPINLYVWQIPNCLVKSSAVKHLTNWSFHNEMCTTIFFVTLFFSLYFSDERLWMIVNVSLQSIHHLSATQVPVGDCGGTTVANLHHHIAAVLERLAVPKLFICFCSLSEHAGTLPREDLGRQVATGKHESCGVLSAPHFTLSQIFAWNKSMLGVINCGMHQHGLHCLVRRRCFHLFSQPITNQLTIQ